MTTSYTTTASQIIDDACYLIGRLTVGNSLPSTEQTIFLRLLNDMIKQWESRGVYLHTTTDITFPLYDSKQSYTLSTTGDYNTGRPLRCLDAQRKDSSGYESPVTMVSRDEYSRITQKDATGLTTMAWYERLTTYGKLYVWPVGDTASTSLTDAWTNSSGTSGEYYYTGTISEEPTYVIGNGTKLEEGTLGSLTAGQYAYGDNDSLGANTLYVKLSTGPSGQGAGYIKTLPDTTSALIATIQRPIDIFDNTTDTGDFPSEAFLALKYGLAALLSDGTGVSADKRRDIKAEADKYFNIMKSTDQENISFTIQPETR